MRTKTKGMNLKLLAVLEEKGISNIKLADLCGFTQSDISRYLHNRLRLTEERKKTIAKALRVKVSDVF